jgi:hypothetical protein
MNEYTILEQVKIRLKQFHIEDETGEDVVVFDSKEDNLYIQQLIKQVENEIKKRRNYPSSYTEEQIAADMANYEDVIVNLVVYDHSQAGEAYMETYSENGVSRKWVERNKLMSGVITLAKIP